MYKSAVLDVRNKAGRKNVSTERLDIMADITSTTDISKVSLVG